MMKYLSFAELRQKLGGRGRTTVYRDVDEKRLPAPIKLGGRLYWIESAVDDAIAAAQSQAA
jgi:prophage regulatory protein